jgi:hypothetical protein
MLLDGDDGVAARAGVAAEGEHGHAGIDARRDQVRLVGLDSQFSSTAWAPSR